MKNIALYIGPGVNSSTINLWNEQYHSNMFPRRSKLLLYKENDFTPEKLKDIDCILLPGGSGSKICKGLGEEGRAAIRESVTNGTSIMGVCAGAYALLSGYEWSLGMINFKIIDRNDLPKASKFMKIGITEEGSKYFQYRSIDFQDIWYNNGPVMVQAFPTDEESGVMPWPFDHEVLATFIEPIYESNSQHFGQEIGTPAIIKTNFGEGKVIAISPHFEKSGVMSHIPTYLMEKYLL